MNAIKIVNISQSFQNVETEKVSDDKGIPLISDFLMTPDPIFNV